MRNVSFERVCGVLGSRSSDKSGREGTDMIGTTFVFGFINRLDCGSQCGDR